MSSTALSAVRKVAALDERVRRLEGTLQQTLNAQDRLKERVYEGRIEDRGKLYELSQSLETLRARLQEQGFSV